MSEEEKNQLSFKLTSGSKTLDNKNVIDSEGDSLEWVCHPAKRNMRVTVLVTIFLVVLIVIVYYTTYSIWFGFLAFLILFGSLSVFYFPTRYKMTDDEVIIKTVTQTLKKKWSLYRTFYPDKNGILLSPFARRTRMENFRGNYIRFWYNKDEVVAFVKKRMEAQKESAGEKDR